jgi:exodeoxyribonuclease-1
MDFVDRDEAFLMMEFDPARMGQFVVTTIGQNPIQPNIIYIYDLSADPAEFRGLSGAELEARLARRPKPIRKVKANAAPCLCPLSEVPPEILGSTSADEFVRRVRVVRSAPTLTRRLLAVATGAETTHPASPCIEQRIHDGFLILPRFGGHPC